METQIKQGGMTPALAKAIALFQENAPEITLDKEVNTGKFKYKYASLKHILEKCRPALKEAGLTFVQILDDTKVTTQIIAVETGDFLESTLQIKANDDPKSQGSAITYARRYALGAALGIVPDDDSDAPAAKREENPRLNEKQMLKVIEKVMAGESEVLQQCLDSFTLTAEQVRKIVEAEAMVNNKVEQETAA